MCVCVDESWGTVALTIMGDGSLTSRRSCLGSQISRSRQIGCRSSKLHIRVLLDSITPKQLYWSLLGSYSYCYRFYVYERNASTKVELLVKRAGSPPPSSSLALLLFCIHGVVKILQNCRRLARRRSSGSGSTRAHATAGRPCSANCVCRAPAHAAERASGGAEAAVDG